MYKRDKAVAFKDIYHNFNRDFLRAFGSIISITLRHDVDLVGLKEEMIL